MKKKKSKLFDIKAESFFDIAGVMFLVLDSNGVVCQINGKGCKILGYSKKYIVGKNWFDNFLPKPVRHKVKKVYHQLMAGKIKPIEYYQNPVLTKNNQEKIVTWHNAILKDEKGKIIGTLSSGEDITKQKEAEDKNEHMNKVLHSIRNVNQLIIKERNKERLIREICHLLTETRGYESAWIGLLDGDKNLIMSASSGLSKRFTDLITAMKKGRMNACCQLAVKQSNVVVINDRKTKCGNCPLLKEKSSSRAMTIRIQHGKTLYGLLSVKVPAHFALNKEEQDLFSEVAGDIAFALYNLKVEKEERKTWETLHFLSSVIEQSTEGLAVSDLKGDLLFVNQAFAVMHGYLPKELIGKHLSIFHTSDQISEVEEIIGHIQNKGHFSGEVWHHRRDGTVFPTLMNNSLFKDENNNPIGMIATLRDISEHKKVEKELKESEKKYRGLFENSTDFVFTLDLKGDFTNVNQSAEKLTGYTKAELMGMNFIDYTPRKTHREVFHAFSNIFKTGKSLKDFPLEVIIKDGTIKYFETSVSILQEDGDIIGLQGISRDVTERRLADEKVRAEHEFTDTILDAQLDTFFLFEPATGKAMRWNRAFKEITGYSDEEIIRMPAPASYYSSEDLKRANIFIQKVLKEETGTIELELICKDGHKVPTEYRVSTINDNQGKPKYIISIGRDVTERKLTEDALQESEELLRNIFESMHEGMMVLDKEFKYVHWNKAMEKIFNTAREEVLGKVPWEVFPFLEGNMKKAMKKAMKGNSLLNEVLQYKLKTGKEGWTSETYSPLHNQNGEVVGVVGVIEDITTRKKAEEALHSSEERYRTFFQTTRDCVFITSKDGHWLDLNNAAVELFGYKSKKELSKVRIADLYAQFEDRKQHIKLIEKQGYVIENPIDLKRKDGSIIHTLITTVPKKDKQGKVVAFQGTIRNITEQKKAEDAIRESERKMKILMSNLPGMVYRCRNDHAWTMDFVSEGSFSLTGYKPAELINNQQIAYGHIIHFDDRKEVWKKVQKSLKKKKHFELEYRIVTKDKIEKWVWERGRGIFNNNKLLFLEGFISDITKRKEATKALLVSEEKFRKSIMEAPYPAMVHAEDGEIILVNKMWETISGYTLREIPTTYDWTEKGYGREKDKVKNNIDKLYSLNKKMDEGEYTINTKKGDKVIWNFSSSPLGRDDKDRKLVLSMAHDVTRQKKDKDRQQQVLRELNFINRTIIKISRMVSIEDICDYIGEIFHKVNPKTYVAVSLYDPEIGGIRLRTLVGFEKYKERILKIAGKDPTRIIYRPNEYQENTSFYTSGKLEQVPGGLYFLLEGKIPEAACRTAEKLLGIDKIFTIGFALKDKPYGGVIILTPKDQDINYSSALETITSHVSEILQRRQIENALKQSNERFRLASKAASDLIYEWDIKTDRMEWFGGLEKALDYNEGEIPYTVKGWLELIHPEERSDIKKVVEKHRYSLEPGRDEYRVRKKDGTWRYWVDLGISMQDEQGEPIKRIGACVDITEQQKAEEQNKQDLKEKEILLKEIHHRVKNNLNVIVSLLNLQSNKIKDKEQALRAFKETRDRVYSMALVHDQLYQSDSFSHISMKSYIKTMAKSLLSSLSRGKIITLDIKIKDIFLDIDKAIPCGLILNEIVTNALKHAFLQKNKGKIYIEFQKIKNKYEFLVRDDGVGIPDNINIQKTKSLGLRLIFLLTEQLDGDIAIKKKKGTEFRITFPVREKGDE